MLWAWGENVLTWEGGGDTAYYALHHTYVPGLGWYVAHTATRVHAQYINYSVVNVLWVHGLTTYVCWLGMWADYNMGWLCSCVDYVHVLTMYMCWLCACVDYVHVLTMCMCWLCIWADYVHVLTMCMCWLCACVDYVYGLTMCMCWLCACVDYVHVLTMYIKSS